MRKQMRKQMITSLYINNLRGYFSSEILEGKIVMIPLFYSTFAPNKGSAPPFNP